MKYASMTLYQKVGLWGSLASLVALPLAFIALFPSHSVDPPVSPTASKPEFIVQSGSLPPRVGTQDVFYATPFLSPPELTWASTIGSPLEYEFLEQRSDGFRVAIKKVQPGLYQVRSSYAWQAKGRPRSTAEPDIQNK